ncbi:MAG TPA: D-2-hydroxyacid dehydrogenase [Candidatus Acidoferrum sp.]|nr:D-2-hydroxyacid dehydrogenase [Candidatus Acidoferrum sp.]
MMVDVLVYDVTDAARYAELIRAPRGRVDVRVAATAEEAAKHIATAEVLYAWKPPLELYARAERLRWLHAMGAGVDWALVPELPKRVVVTRSPGVFGPWMAEYVIGWSLWVTQRMAQYREAQTRREWIQHHPPERLAGKTMAIVGLGDIGRAVARAARQTGVRVIGVTRSARPVSGVERVYRSRDLSRALAVADFVVLVIPLNDTTRGLIGAAELAAMRPTAWLINIGRGALIDEGALVQALQHRTIAGAVLDVFTTEPLPRDHPLWTLDNAVITPHISGPNLPEEIVPVFNDNLTRYLARRPLRHVVDRRRGY